MAHTHCPAIGHATPPPTSTGENPDATLHENQIEQLSGSGMVGARFLPVGLGVHR